MMMDGEALASSVLLEDSPAAEELPAKFEDMDVTATGERRASVPLSGLRTLWFNTGTLCNIECENCYILSSPTNDALVYLTADEVTGYLDQIDERRAARPDLWPVEEIGFTGGEPFMNPEIIAILDAALSRGHRVLVLTNAMRPMMRRRVREGLVRLRKAHGERLVLRVSLDHHTAALHDEERGAGSFAIAMEGLRWLAAEGFRLDAAGRTCWDEPEAAARAGYAALFEAEGVPIPAGDPARCILFPEMDEGAEVPEITTRCWGILGKKPSEIMCASSRMVVRRKGADAPVVLACTLLPYDPRFETGATLKEAERPIKLAHPHCAKFCVLGGGSCSG